MIENYISSQLSELTLAADRSFSAIILSDPLVALELCAILLTICYLVRITLISRLSLTTMHNSNHYRTPKVLPNRKTIGRRLIAPYISSSVFEVGKLISLPKQAVLRQKV